MKRMSRPHLKQEAFNRVAVLTQGTAEERLERLIHEEARRRVDSLDLIARFSLWNAAHIEEEMERALRNDRRGRTGKKPRLTAELLQRLEAWMDYQVKDLTERLLRDKRLAAKEAKKIPA